MPLKIFPESVCPLIIHRLDLDRLTPKDELIDRLVRIHQKRESARDFQIVAKD